MGSKRGGEQNSWDEVEQFVQTKTDSHIGFRDIKALFGTQS